MNIGTALAHRLKKLEGTLVAVMHSIFFN